MRLIYLFPILFFAILFAPFSQAQTIYSYIPDNSVQVNASGYTQTTPWSGGFNNPQFSNADINNDGLADLVEYEPNLGVKTFLNMGTAGSPIYVYAPEYALNFPPCLDYMLMADYNRDGIADLFEGEYDGTTGFIAYKGYYNSSNQLCFNQYKTLYYNNDADAGFSWVNAFNNPSYMPAIVDVDGDGDLDFIAYEVLGFNMYYFRNMQVEDGEPSDSITLELEDQCWGKVWQSYYRSYNLAQSCNNSNLYYLDNSYYRTMHGGNTICLFDYDGDGDYDCLNGNYVYNQMTFLLNGKVETSNFADTMIAQDTMWQAAGKQVNIGFWPAAFNVDVDVDGKKDLLISPNGIGGENYKTIWYYKNQSTAGHPDWVFQSDSFLVDQTIDVGISAHPAYFDFNKDGKPDLFVGSDGYYDTATGQLVSRISYYENTSVPGTPSLTLIAKNFLNLDTFSFAGASPAFGDLDNDGITDMVIGHSDGTITFYKNMAASNSVTPVFVPRNLAIKSIDSNVITANGQHAFPFIYDIDKDGKPDLLVGDYYGYLEFYHNVSPSPGILALSFDNRNLGGIRADPTNNLGPNYSTPFIGKIDTTGNDYLLMGSFSGNIYLYTGFQAGDTTATYTLLDTSYCYIDTTYSYYNHGESLIGFYNGIRSHPAVASIPSDHTFDMVVGEIRGGLNLYKYGSNPTGINNFSAKSRISIYPNPANTVAHLSWDNVSILAGNFQVSITNTQGITLYKAIVDGSLKKYDLPVGNLAPGIYICVLQSGESRYYAQLVVMH